MLRPKTWKIEAFAEGSLQGNPAGVVILPGQKPWPDDEILQSLAKDVGFLETAYVRRQSDGKFHLRWFTPTVEVDLCGHAILAAAFALWESATVDSALITFTSRSGDLAVTRDPSSERITLDFPVDPPAHDFAAQSSEEIRSSLAAALGIDAGRIIDCFQGKFDTVVVVNDERIIFRCAPDMAELEKFDIRGVIITARSAPASAADFTSRFFAPKYGVPEDPVTGSAHCLLGPYWAGELGVHSLIAYQASERGGLLYLEMPPDSDRIFISGHARLMLK